MSDEKPIWRAALVAPLAAPFILTLAPTLLALPEHGLSAFQGIQFIAFFFFLFGLPISYLGMFALGMPYVLWLRSRGRLTWRPVCLGAAVIGSVVLSGYSQLDLASPALHFGTIAFGAAAGLAVSIVFCLLARIQIR